MRRLLVAVAVIVAIAAFALLRKPAAAPHSAASPASADRPAVATVTTERAAYRSLPASLSITGAVAARDMLSIGSEVNGLRIESVPVEEGQMVRRGQPLAVLNSSILRAQLEQQRARLASSRANISKVIQPNRPQDLASLELAVSQARANQEQEEANLRQAESMLAQAERERARYAGLKDQGFATQQEVEQRNTDAQMRQAQVQAARERASAARFALEQARQRLSLAHAGGRSEDVTMASASAAEIEAVIAQLEAQLEQTVIRAPDDGLIVQRDAHLGEIPGPNKVLFVIARRAEMEVRGQVPESELARISTGQQAIVSISGRPVKGRVWQISPSVDPATRLGTVRIALPVAAGPRPGTFVHATLDMGARKTLTIPSKAVQGQMDQHYVYRVEDGRFARRQPVTVGSRAGNVVEVTSGVRAGDPVVVDGAGFLNDGDAVLVRNGASARQ